MFASLNFFICLNYHLFHVLSQPRYLVPKMLFYHQIHFCSFKDQIQYHLRWLLPFLCFLSSFIIFIASFMISKCNIFSIQNIKKVQKIIYNFITHIFCRCTYNLNSPVSSPHKENRCLHLVYLLLTYMISFMLLDKQCSA